MALVAFGAALATEVPYPQMIHWNGTRGLSQTRSAESLGEGYMTLAASGSWYEVDQEVIGSTPPPHTNVQLGMLSLGLGLGPWADFSVWTSAFNVPGWDSANIKKSGFGASGAQLQLQGPWDEDFPLRAAVQLGILGGSQNPIQTGLTADGKARADGWDYVQTRTGYDVQATFLQTLRLGSESFPVRIHLNEGLLSSLKSEHEDLLMIDGGLELTPVSVLTIGMEGHQRSFLDKYDMEQDPFWVTGSFTFHLPGDANFQIGGDLRLSSGRSTERDKNALDPWRAFGSFTVGFDLLAGKRKAQQEALMADSMEHQRLNNLIAEGEAKARRIQKSMDSSGEVTRANLADRDSLEARLRADSTRLMQGL